MPYFFLTYPIETRADRTPSKHSSHLQAQVLREPYTRCILRSWKGLHRILIMKQEYYASTPCTMTSPFSTGSNTQGFVTTPVTPPRPASQTTIFNMPTPISPSVLEAIIKSIPALFRNICPFSLTGTPCPISSCQMKRLCPRFNNQSGISTCQGRNGCRHLHEHPTCLSEAEGMGCGYTQHNSNEPQSPKGKGKWKGKGKEKMSEWDAARKLHFRCTVHPSQCGPEEWRLRLVIAGLRHAHKQGLYKN